ncbi:MAG TPA: amino acid adenylation domain-containing protein [Pyrinomonadaceae bacterium]|nr:amino acid adenylation domain-containing protein [Pyrinomonadaceae bacterium]
MSIEGLQLSPQQKHLWSLTRGDDSETYQARCLVRLQGKLNKNALTRAINEIVKRHEILRTTFRIFPGLTMPLQVIDQSAKPAITEIDLTSLTEQRQALELDALFQCTHQQAFGSGSPLRTTLVCLSESEHALLLNLSPACADLLTLDNLIQEISKGYDAHLRGEQFSDAPLQYADVSTVFNELLESEETETGRSYWQQHDLSSVQRQRLVSEIEVSATRAFETATVATELGTDIVTKLDSFAQQFDVAPSVVFFTCWQVLLGRLIGHADLVVGANYDGRSYEGLAEALGLFARFLPIRCHIDDEQTLANLLQQVDKTLNEVHEWQDYFSLSRNGSNGANAPEVTYLPYCFEFENPNSTYLAGDIVFAVAKRHTCFDRFKLKLRCTREDAVIRVELHRDVSAFHSADVEVLLDQFQALLQSALDNPHHKIDTLEILGARERERILIDFNRTQADYPPAQNVQQLFEEQVARTPDAIAVSFKETQLTYQALNARANQLAHHLRELGVGPEHRVGLYLERGLEMIVGVLGILKAGAAYVPLDPASPRERLAFIIEEARVSVLITQEALATSISDKQLQAVLLDADSKALASASTDNPPRLARPNNLAYIIYTSGSTGRPKGVMVEQRSIINLVFALRDTVYRNLGVPLNVALNAPLFFDASVKQLMQLMQGHHLHIVPEEVRADPAKFLSLIERNKLASFDCTPTQLKSLLTGGLAESNHTPAMILVGGEDIDASTWRLLATNESTSYFNVYGPTECTVDTTTCAARESPEQASIGRPIPNTQVYILDKELRPAPIGVPGEICIGGAGLARGYVEQPTLTAEAFVPNPFSTRGGERLYKTGDIARYLPDGRIKYIGRKDSQIKLNGFRIELKEIEAVILEHQAVRDAVVVSRQNTLIAYLVSRNGDLKKAELRSFLRERLPEYMIPSAYVSLSALPLTVNGKVDRQKLPDPQENSSALSIKYEAPCTDTERTIASIWREELQLEKVGIHDNFFDLGGSSLIMVRVFDRLQTTFGNRLKMVELFRHPTIATLAKHLSQDQPQAFSQARVDNLVNRQKEARSQRRQTKVRIQRAGN